MVSECREWVQGEQDGEQVQGGEWGGWGAGREQDGRERTGLGQCRDPGWVGVWG